MSLCHQGDTSVSSPLTLAASSGDLVHGQTGQDRGLVSRGIPAGRDRAMAAGDRALGQVVTVHNSLREAGLGPVTGVEVLRGDSGVSRDKRRGLRPPVLGGRRTGGWHASRLAKQDQPVNGPWGKRSPPPCVCLPPAAGRVWAEDAPVLTAAGPQQASQPLPAAGPLLSG